MQNSKKWSVIALASFVLVSVAYFGSTGKLSGLKSSALMTEPVNVCQPEKLPFYSEYQKTLSELDVLISDIKTLKVKIKETQSGAEAAETEIQARTKQNASYQTQIASLTKANRTLCSNPRQALICRQNRAQIAKFEVEIKNNNKKITDFKKTNVQLEKSLKEYENQYTKLDATRLEKITLIGVFEKQIEEACKPPVISGEVRYRMASWECHDESQARYKDVHSCTDVQTWKSFSEVSCQNKCSQETGKCGVNRLAYDEKCDIQIPTVCGNGIREGNEQCDDGNKNDEDECTNSCTPSLCSILWSNTPGCENETGNLSITPDPNNTDNQSHKIILAGTTQKVFSVDIQSQKEPVKVQKVVFEYTSNVGHLQSSQAELWLNGNKVADAASLDIKAANITFDNINNLIIPENNSELVLVISTMSIGYEKIGVVAKDVKITQVTVSEATGQKSGKDIPQVSTDVSGSSASFSISPALIVPSIVSVLSSSSAQAKIKLIANVGGNTPDSSGTTPTISLDSLTFSKSGNVGITPTDYVLYEEGKPSVIVNGAASGENIVFDLTAFPHSDFIQSKTYIIVPTMTEGETASLRLLQNGIRYDIHGINDATDFKSALSQELDLGSRTIN